MRRTKGILAAVLLLPIAGCTTLRPISAPDQYIAQSSPERVYVLRGDNSMSVIDEPAVVGSQLTGRFAGTVVQAEVPLSDVSEVRVRQSAPAKTALLAGGIGVGVGMIVFLATRSDLDDRRPQCPQFYCGPGDGYGNPPPTFGNP